MMGYFLGLVWCSVMAVVLTFFPEKVQKFLTSPMRGGEANSKSWLIRYYRSKFMTFLLICFGVGAWISSYLLLMKVLENDPF
jgi:hypothetical protein